MDIRDLIALNSLNFDEETEEAVFTKLSSLRVEEVPKKHLRKILEISLALLDYKDKQVLKLQAENDDSLSVSSDQPIDEQKSSKLLGENSRLKSIVNKLENEKLNFKSKMKELTEEIYVLQKRLQESTTYGSDKEDSSDPLSELDRQEELLKNISTKNKHIKRLLVDIEVLERQNIDQSKTIIDLENKIQFTNSDMDQLKSNLSHCEDINIELKDSIKNLNEEINRLEGNITFLEEERERTDLEFRTFVEKLEERAILWKKILDDKENQLDSLRKKYEELYHQNPIGTIELDQDAEVQRLVEAMQERDCVIEELESRLKAMADEMITSTKLMNKLSAERETKTFESASKNRSCCKQLEESLELANIRCKELAEMMENIEEQSILKSKQATEAINALQAYQNGEDGLAQCLRKSSNLQQKLNSRDKQIKALVMEINSLHEIAQENSILRQRLNIPDDVVISTTNLKAKQRNKDKMIERLNLKLRASEEMRLQLKLEKNELRKEINDVRLNIGDTKQDTEIIQPIEQLEAAVKEVYCNNCLKNLKDTDERKLQLKMGKYFDCTCNRCSDSSELGTFMGSILCEYCKNSLVSRNSELVWRCNNCHNIIQNDNIKALLQKIKIEILEANGDIRALEKLILKYSRILNPNHYLVVDMKQQVAAFLRAICMDELHPPGKRVLKRKLAICQDILIVLRKIQPGISRLTGIALYECVSPMMKLAQNQLDEGDIQENEYLTLQPDTTMQEIIKEWEEKYSSVVEENENLRVGMHEILEKIREYDSSSDHITIDCSILQKVLHALDARSISGWYHPAMRMQNELIAVKEREQALRDQINLAEKFTIIQDEKSLPKDTDTSEEIESTQKPKEAEAHPKIEYSPIKQTYQQHDTIEESDSLYPIIVQKDIQLSSIESKFLEIQEKYRNNLIELETLKCIKMQYNELTENLKGSEDKITEYCSILVEKITDFENIQLIAQKKYEFLKEDYDRTLNEYKTHETLCNSIIASLKMEIINLRSNLNGIKFSQVSQNLEESNNLIKNMLTKDNILLKAQLSFLINEFYSGNIETSKLPPEENLSENIIYEVIDDNFKVDYITLNEFENIKNERDESKTNFEQSKNECNNLKELLKVAHDQIKFHQKQLLEITDNQIHLRHLVADLQSSSEDKYIIAKFQRELDLAKQEVNILKDEKDKLKEENSSLRQKLEEEQLNVKKIKQHLVDHTQNNDLKIKYLKKSLKLVHDNYCKYTPLVLLVDFVRRYSKCMQKCNNVEERSHLKVWTKFEETLSTQKDISSSMELVKVVKLETKCEYLEEQSRMYHRRAEQLQSELDKARLNFVEISEHWKTINALFGDPEKSPIDFDSKFVQAVIECKDASVNTEDQIITLVTPIPSNESPVKLITGESEETKKSEESKESEETKETPPQQSPVIESVDTNISNSLEAQLKEAMNLASLRSTALLETENRLAESQAKIKEMEKSIDEKNLLLRQEMEKCSNAEEKAYMRNSGMVESTITSFQSILSEKDTLLSHYQELLKTEREQHSKSCENYDMEISTLKKTFSDQENQIKTKDAAIDELKLKIEELKKNESQPEDRTNTDDELKRLEDDVSNLNEISDEKIEEMFMDEQKHLSQHVLHETIHPHLKPEKEDVTNRQIKLLQNQLRESNNREIFWEKTVREKEQEIDILREKFSVMEEKEKADISTNTEIEQLRILLEDKDKHINDLTETLTSFHYDQQRFITETSIYSADQVSQLGADLTRSEATNKILNTQLEALKRQLATLTQREKQARDLANSLKTQLIKRPVISVKSELNARTKTEQLQKRIHQLEFELDEANKEIKKQANIIETKRAKNAADISLWQKQKQWQQNAEKLKIKLQETEASLERTRILLNTARTNINRVEKEKHVMEMRLRGKGCCRTPSCPNLLKYGTSESPDSCTLSSECISPIKKRIDISDSNQDLINALKSRIESQQRKIVAYELENRGSNAVTAELEKFQEQMSSLEAQNIRLEAKNLQLQLNADMIRQGDESERLHRRIKHLEDYIIALKEELADAQARRETLQQANRSDKNSVPAQMDQTILALRRIVDRLRVENKNLKEGRRGSYDIRTNEISEVNRLQVLYAESLDKIATLQMDLQRKTGSSCPNCQGKYLLEGGGELLHELKITREKLTQKSQLLEKAKILLTRAAAKEKNLKEQIIFWKRKCSELQNVPVIDEISE